LFFLSISNSSRAELILPPKSADVVFSAASFPALAFARLAGFVCSL
jgi:hypothetical protein